MVHAVGRLVDAGRELSVFAGYTERISLLNDVLEDLNNGRFVRTQVADKQIVYKEKRGKVIETTDEEGTT